MLIFTNSYEKLRKKVTINPPITLSAFLTTNRQTYDNNLAILR